MPTGEPDPSYRRSTAQSPMIMPTEGMPECTGGVVREAQGGLKETGLRSCASESRTTRKPGNSVGRSAGNALRKHFEERHPEGGCPSSPPRWQVRRRKAPATDPLWGRTALSEAVFLSSRSSRESPLDVLRRPCGREPTPYPFPRAPCPIPRGTHPYPIAGVDMSQGCPSCGWTGGGPLSSNH